MKPVIIFVATFTIAMGAATGAKVVLSKPAPHAAAGADSASVRDDTTHTDTAIVSPAKSDTPPADSAHLATRPDSANAAAVASTKTTASAASPTTAAPAAAVASDSTVQAQERRLAKVFTAMDAKQAAKVLEHMDDHDVQVILGYVGPRQAASIMNALPAQRVAALSKLAMGGSGVAKQ